MSVAQSHPHSSKDDHEAGWTAKQAVGMCVCVVVDILQGQGRTACSMVDSASAVTVRAGVLVQKRTPTAARMMSRNMVCLW